MSEAVSISILGSTGSVGRNTLAVLDQNPGYRVFALSAHRNVELLLKQCQQYQPDFAVVTDAASAEQFAGLLAESDCATVLLTASDALERIASDAEVQVVMAAIVGAAGLESTLAAVAAGKKVLLANKESVVMSGELFMESAARNGATIIPIDSEHNAIFQCLTRNGEASNESPMAGVEKLVLTASGGPFLGTELQQFDSITPEQACKHPQWSMGRKISVDSATMMNKGLEFIEASYLFGANAEQIEILIHPQSIIHSMVHYRDGSVLAQLANPDMRVPIAHGLAYPERITSGVKPLRLAEIGTLQFETPDTERFPCLSLGIEAAKQGGTAPTALNAANEEAVAAFLEGVLRFTQIPLIIETVMSKIPCEAALSLAIIQDIDRQARSLSKKLISKDFH
ncbi:MAG TPA: 1-deoxy-D-xylulose-5-phosphate reductoisomerase [Gammaproteobacteria bacterium]|nr:1-deoxy-D-xylulose-5-phosphate reductoisomerase [Gammaproteobacteria bacterium]